MGQGGLRLRVHLALTSPRRSGIGPRALVIVGLVALALLVIAGLAVTHQRHEGYFAPVFADGGRSVVYVQRNTAGFVWGLGWEFFTPPAQTWTVDDRVSLRRLDRATRRVDVLARWPRSPIVGRVIDEYRSRSFATLDAALEADSAGRIRYAIGLSIPRVPFSERFRIRGEWSQGGARDSGWVPGDALATLSEPVLDGATEVMTVRGRESFPAAIVAYDSRSRTAEVLIRSGALTALYADSLPLADLDQRSRRPSIERADTLRRVYAEHVARFAAQGGTEGDAALRAIREMERLGFYPRSPFIVARRVAARAAAAGTVPTFAITDDEFRFGLFQDLERAIAAPGDSVEFSGGYITHRDFTTSGRLNDWLQSGGRVFRVRRDDGSSYEITLTRPER